VWIADGYGSDPDDCMFTSPPNKENKSSRPKGGFVKGTGYDTPLICDLEQLSAYSSLCTPLAIFYSRLLHNLHFVH
jgi:hypothetical protein